MEDCIGHFLQLSPWVKGHVALYFLKTFLEIDASASLSKAIRLVEDRGSSFLSAASL